MMASAARRWVGAGFEPEHVAGQMKRADLAASVGKQLVGANRAADHLIDIFRRLILAVDLLVLPVGEFGRDQARHARSARRTGRAWEGTAELTLLPMTEVLSDWVSMAISFAADDQLLRGLIGGWKFRCDILRGVS